jgi:hypothetical protein
VSATAKFYSSFFLCLALVIGLSFYGGYRAGLQHERAVLHEARRLPPVSVPSGAPPATSLRAP